MRVTTSQPITVNKSLNVVPQVGLGITGGLTRVSTRRQPLQRPTRRLGHILTNICGVGKRCDDISVHDAPRTGLGGSHAA